MLATCPIASICIPQHVSLYYLQTRRGTAATGPKRPPRQCLLLHFSLLFTTHVFLTLTYIPTITYLSLLLPIYQRNQINTRRIPVNRNFVGGIALLMVQIPLINRRIL